VISIGRYARTRPYAARAANAKATKTNTSADFLGGFAKDYGRSADEAVASRAKGAGTHAKAVLEVVRQFEKSS
jgi:hypothetical protein